jgi:hypothetical protein
LQYRARRDAAANRKTKPRIKSAARFAEKRYLPARAVGCSSSTFSPVVSLADLSTENARAGAAGGLNAPEPALADSEGALGAAIAAGLCSGVCAKLGTAVKDGPPITASDKATMTIRGLIVKDSSLESGSS